MRHFEYFVKNQLITCFVLINTQQSMESHQPVISSTWKVSFHQNMSHKSAKKETYAN